MFPVIHPKKANDSKYKWNELPILITSRLLAFSKDKVRYGVYFLEPVDPEKDGCANYRKVIS
jgi:chromodomain-helicase-DNA-binding protein 7